MKQQRCTEKNCNDPIPEGQEAYINGKLVCQYCFNKLRLGHKNREGGKEGLRIAYKRWLTRK